MDHTLGAEEEVKNISGKDQMGENVYSPELNASTAENMIVKLNEQREKQSEEEENCFSNGADVSERNFSVGNMTSPTGHVAFDVNAVGAEREGLTDLSASYLENNECSNDMAVMKLTNEKDILGISFFGDNGCNGPESKGSDQEPIKDIENNDKSQMAIHPIHDQTLFLNERHKKQLKEEFDVEPWTFEQYLGEAVLIPAGCPHQVRNRQSCIKVAMNFVSPDNIEECIRLTNEFRMLPKNHRAKEDKLEVKKMVLYAVSSAVKEAQSLTPNQESQNCVLEKHIPLCIFFLNPFTTRPFNIDAAVLQNIYALILGDMLLRRLAVVVPRSTRFFSSKDNHDLASTIAELNKEMESVFGEPPLDGFDNSGNKSFMGQESQNNSHVISGSASNKFTAQELHSVSQILGENVPGLTHVGSAGKAQMVDVSPKESSSRTATASCKVVLGKKVFNLVLANQMAKGDVLSVAKIAGINGAKHTSTLIPLCHNITLTHVRVDLRLNSEDFSVEIEGEAASTGKTGVEMEAMTAVSVAGLTVYDMCKAASKDIQITDVRLERKTGGKSGYWCREE
ncbi:hypothetical protein CRYUN_Cryun23aG0126600 [Craigia yunnanensis]